MQRVLTLRPLPGTCFRVSAARGFKCARSSVSSHHGRKKPMQAYRAASLFQPSNLAGAIADSANPNKELNHLYGSALTYPCATVARTISCLGLDFVMIDALHTSMGAETLTQLIQTINLGSGGDTVAVVRVPSAHSHLLTHALDAGAAGIIFPHIDTAEEAEEAVSRCRYASSGGHRSLAPFALVPGLMDVAPPGETHTSVADAHVAVICQIESALAVNNATSIANTPGVASLMLGPGDLRLSYRGLASAQPGRIAPERRFHAAVDHLVAVSRQSHKPLMTVTFKMDEDDAWLADFRLLVTSADFLNIVEGQKQGLEAVKARVEKLTRAGEDDGNVGLCFSAGAAAAAG